MVAPRAGRPRVLALEWTAPFVGGHWVPEQIEAAGGHDVLGIAGRPSFRTTWETIAQARPDVVIVLRCGFTLDEVCDQAAALDREPAWRDLSAVRNGLVWAAVAIAWFSRTGPSVLDGIASILADPPARAELPGTPPGPPEIGPPEPPRPCSTMIQA